MTNEQKKNYLIQVFKFMREHPDLDHEATKRIIENILKSIDLSDQETRNSFKSFFILFKDIFDLNEEIVKAGVSLYFESFEAKLNIVRNFWMDHLMTGLIELKSIMPLNISQNALKQKDLEFLIYTLKDNKFITSLNISKNFGYSDEKNIKALANLQYVKTLDISSNNFTPEDIKEFAKILKENKSIETLKFADNNLKGDALEEFLEALKVNKTITSLDIGGNKLQPAGFELLVEALKVNKVLKKLFIYDDWAFESAEYKLRNAIEERGVELEILPYKNEATQ